MKHKFIFLIYLLFVATSIHAYDFEIDGVYYSITDKLKNTVKVTYGDFDYIGNVSIPCEVQNQESTYTVTSIGIEAFLGSDIESISLPNTIVRIEREAFQYCTALSEIIIPSSVTDIGDGAFFGCEGLTSLVFPNSVKFIGEESFGGCKNVTNVILPNNLTYIDDGVFVHCTSSL